MMLLDYRRILNELNEKRLRFANKPTIDSLKESIAIQARTRKARLLDFEPWYLAHPEMLRLQNPAVPHEFSAEAAHESHDVQPRFIFDGESKHDEPYHDFSKRFRLRERE